MTFSVNMHLTSYYVRNVGLVYETSIPLHNVVGLEIRVTVEISIISSIKYSFLKHFLNFSLNDT